MQWNFEPNLKQRVGSLPPVSTPAPTTLLKFFGEKGTYPFRILIAADNARPHRDLTVSFDYDPESDDLSFTPLDAMRFPWWSNLVRRVFFFIKR
jgi:hypothetical protein